MGRIGQTVFDQVLKPAVPVAIRNGNYAFLEEVLEMGISPAQQVELSDMVRRGNVENLTFAINNPTVQPDGTVTYQMPYGGPRPEGIGPDEGIPINSVQEMQEYLSEPSFTDPRSLYHIPESARQTILNRFAAKNDMDLKLQRTMDALSGGRSLMDEATVPRALEGLGMIGQDGQIIEGRGAMAGFYMATGGVSGTGMQSRIFSQARNNDQAVSRPAIEALVVMSQHPNKASWNALKQNSANNPADFALLMTIQEIGEDVSFFPNGYEGTSQIDTAALDQVVSMAQENSRTSNPLNLAENEDHVQAAGRSLGMTANNGRYFQSAVEVEVGNLVSDLLSDKHLNPEGSAQLDTSVWYDLWSWGGAEMPIKHPMLQQLTTAYSQIAWTVENTTDLSPAAMQDLVKKRFNNYLQQQFHIVTLGERGSDGEAVLTPTLMALTPHSCGAWMSKRRHGDL